MLSVQCLGTWEYPPNYNGLRMENNENTDIKERYKDKLTAGVYAKKQITDILVQFGSLIGGGLIGNFIGKSFGKKNPASAMESETTTWIPKGIHVVGTAVGAILGSMIGNIIQGYNRWKKHEAERLAIAEINEDVANMKIRHRTDPQLLAENDRLREMLEVESQKTQELEQQVSSKKNASVDKILDKGARTPQNFATQEIHEVSSGVAM